MQRAKDPELSLSRLRLARERAVLLVIDVQERLLAAMPEAARAPLVRGVTTLIAGAAALEVPVLVTEQYPKGLGPTAAPVLQALQPGVVPQAKLDFSALPVLGERLGAARQVVLCGMETHVCVFQTARDLLAAGHEVYVARDAVLSRTAENRDVGLALMAEAGSVIGSVEAALFDLCARAGTPQFKAVSALVK